MKYRTFLTTLTLFLFFFHLGIWIISVSTFKDTVRRAEERSLSEHYFITSALIGDFRAVEERGIEMGNSAGALLQPYSYLSGEREVILALYKNAQLIYSSGDSMRPQSQFLQPPVDGSRLVSMQKSDSRTHVIVSGKLPAPYDAYTMVYLYDTSEEIAAWKRMKNMLFVTGSVLSGALALVLHLLLNRIFRPLSQISQISREIATGAYDRRLPAAGHDELAEMARSFNHMAEEIQRQMRELIEAADAKQRFIDNFAHELRTPLTAIYGYAEYLQKAALTEEDRLSAVGYIMSESRRMQNLANQLLELAKLEHDRVPAEPQQVQALFQSVRRTLHNKIMEKDIQIKYVCETNEIQGDAYLLESLLINLVDNAIKACDKGGRILVHAAAENGRKTISIRDNGRGMKPEVLRHITEPFYRGEKSRSRKDGGAGLGLAICQQIARRHGAELEFDSCPGGGTTAKVYFTTS